MAQSAPPRSQPPAAATEIVLIRAASDEDWEKRLGVAMPDRASAALPVRFRSWTEKDLGDGFESRKLVGPGIGAIIFFISDDLLASPAIYSDALRKVLAEATGRVFRVLSVPTKHELGWLASVARPLGPDDQPLAGLSDDHQAAVLRDIAAALLGSLDVSRESADDVEDPPNDGAPADDTNDASKVPLDRLSEFRTVESIPFLMKTATELATGRIPPISVNTTFMLFAICESAETPGPWTAQFLREFFTRNEAGYEAARDRYLRKRGARELRARSRRSDPGATPVNMTRNLYAALGRSREIALSTTGADVIHGRHLLAALIESGGTREPRSALRRLADMRVDAAALREALFDWVRGQGDDDGAWAEVLIGKAPNVRRLSGFSADRVGGQDLLNIEPEVRALAALIAARTVSPPLSIGLFGEWGSGKTFFMRELRKAIDALTWESRNANVMQRELPFYKHIVQIEFNAWHYVEGNLWASLVEHILANLYPREDPTVSRQLQEGLIKKLAEEKALSQTTSNAVESAKAAAAGAAEELRDAQQKLDAKTRELAALNADHVRRDFVLTGAAEPIATALDRLGLAQVGTAAVELEGALRQIHGVLDRGHRFLTPLTRAKDRGRRFVWLFLSLLGAPIVAMLVHFIMARLASSASDIYAYATGLATLIGSGVPWLKKQAEWMSDRLDEAEKAQKQFDADMAAATADHVRQVTQAEQKLRELTAALDAALQKHAEAKGREAAAAAELDAATTGRLLANFISDRAASSDYRKHLGVLALVRDDFEKLSGLIEEENWKLSPEDPLDPPPRKDLRRYQSLEEEAADTEQRINRIVLYIDDLDRCPPNKVVEVLQAVHLLLAFPLFVVVVGVDARWITRSLQTKYRELLLMGVRSNGATDDTEMLGSATPNDYLEKIFQIPFWLKQMQPNDCDRMVRGLLRSSVAQPSGGAAGTPGNANGGQAAAASPSDPSAQPNGAEQTPSGGTQPAVASDPPATTTPHDSGATPVAPPLESLEITPAELDYMTQLSGLLGRSPRALKRFANVYRLMKVGLRAHEHRTFLRAQTPLAEFQIVLFLLAVDTGTPTAARAFFDEIDRGRNEPAGTTPRDINWLVKELDRGYKQPYKDGASHPDWKRLRLWLTSRTDVIPPTTEVSSLGVWTSRVARYSFEVGRS
jgi:hypothetical protein